MQHNKPCKTCPFLRTVKPGELGGSMPATYIGQSIGPFWIPCHEAVDYSDPNWKEKYATPQCAGAAIYRANIGAHFPKKLLHLESDRSLVFASHDEFLSHHLKVTAARASQILSICTPNEMCAIEMSRAGVKEAKL